MTAELARAGVLPQELVERALELASTDGCIVLASESSEANLRWARNTLTTNGLMRGRQLTVIATVEGSAGTAVGIVSRSNVGLDQLEEVVANAEALAREGRAAEDARPLVTGSAESDWADPPVETSVAVFETMSHDLGEAFGAARSSGRDLFGFAEHQLETVYLGTSTGLRRRHVQPTGRIEITGKPAGDWSRSTWVGQSTRDFRDIDVATLEAQIEKRLGWAQRRINLPAARYEALLPPSAVADLLIYLYWTAVAREANDGRTVFSAPGGGTKVGEQLTSLPVRMWSDPHAPGLECIPFVAASSTSASESVFDNGIPLHATDWIRGGELSALIQTRYSAELTGLPVTPGIDNLLFSSDDATRGLDEMIEATESGLLLNCLWYIREVDPRNLLLTGLTRDGVYLIEGGEVVGEVNNFRFNESPVELLRRLTEVGLTEPTLAREWNDYFTRTAMPAWRVPDFNMSSVSQAS